MLFFYEGYSKAPCIYEIRNRYSNRSYIGQTVKSYDRWVGGHKASLLRNAHGNSFLQNDYNKCKEILGHDDFLEFHVVQGLKKSTPEHRNKRELYWLKKYKKHGYKLYNLIEEFENTYFFSEETRKKMSLAKKGKPSSRKGCSLTEQHKEKLSNAHKGKKLSEEHRAKLAKNFLGKKHTEETKKKLSQIRTGKSTSPKTQFKAGTLHPHTKKIDLSSNPLKSPDGQVFTEIVCLEEFARTHNLDPSHLRRVINGQRKSHHGWTQQST